MTTVPAFSLLIGLVGRESECQLLQDAYQRVLRASSSSSPPSDDDGGGCEAVLIHGESGTGKTALIQHCFLQQHEMGTMISGKFDVTNISARPYSAIVDALTQLCQPKTWNNIQNIKELEDNLQERLGDGDLKILTKFVPAIGHRLMVGATTTTTTAVGSNHGDNVVVVNDITTDDYSSTSPLNDNALFAFARFAEAVRSFLFQVTRCLSSPLVLFLDDVQAADAKSLSLISSLTADHSESLNLLLLLAYRDNNTLQQNPRSFLSSTTLFRVTDIQLHNLDADGVNYLVCKLLRMDPEETMPLSLLITQRTGGNVYFSVQFLEMLKSEKLLTYSFGVYQWEWHLEKIRADTNVTDNVAALLTSKIQQLPPAVQSTLQLAACLGFYFDIVSLERLAMSDGVLKSTIVESTSSEGSLQSGGTSNIANEEDVEDLVTCKNDSSIEFHRAIDIAVEENLIDRADEAKYKFTHDRVLETTYCMIPFGNERDMLHWQIGQVLWTELQEQDHKQDRSLKSDDWLLFAAADQLNRGSGCILTSHDGGGVTPLAHSRLNLEAGKAALEKSAFKYAAGFFDKGVKLVNGMWETDYPLCLELHTLSAETEYAASNFDNCDQRARDILANGRCLEDKVPAYFLKVKSQGVRGQVQEAIDESIIVLRVLGERIPRHPSLWYLQWELLKITRAMKGRKADDLVSLPDMTDSHKIWVTKFLHNLVVMLTWHPGKHVRIMVYACRLMLLTIKYGVSSQGPYAMANYGLLLGLLGDWEGAYEAGKVAMEIAKRPQTTRCYACSVTTVYAFLHHLRQPLIQCFNHFMEGYYTGIKSGEIEGAALCLQGYASLGVYLGKKLDIVRAEMEGFRQAYRDQVERNYALNLTTPMLQFVIDIMEGSDNPPKLLDTAFVESYLVLVQRNEAGMITMNIVRLMFLYIMSDFEEANKEVAKVNLKFAVKGTHFGLLFLFMYAGLNLLAMFRKTAVRKFWRQANMFKRVMERLAKAGNLNMPPMLQLMSAEQASLRRRCQIGDVKKAYETALRVAAQSGFSVVEAIGNERAGEYMLSIGDTFWAETFLTRAFLLYEEWGAEAKTKQMLKEHTFLNGAYNRPSLHRNVSLTLRKRYSYKEEDETTRRQINLE